MAKAKLVFTDEALATASMQMRTILNSLGANDVTKENIDAVVAAIGKLNTFEEQLTAMALIARSHVLRIAVQSMAYTKWMHTNRKAINSL